MRTKILGSVAAAAAAVALTLTPAGTAVAAGTATIQVPSGFDHHLSDTRPGGHYEVVGSALHIWTDSNTSDDKVAEYVDTSTPLADAGEPSLDYTTNSGTIPPGYQLVVDFDDDGTPDGILVGEPTYYGNDWWLSDGSAQFVKDGAPSHTGGSGSSNHGTLDQWRAAFPEAQVLAFGFSLGSGVQGDYTLNAITFAGTKYTFAANARPSADTCKHGGWKNSTDPVYRNQGQCVSHFASAKSHRG